MARTILLAGFIVIFGLGGPAILLRIKKWSRQDCQELLVITLRNLELRFFFILGYS